MAVILDTQTKRTGGRVVDCSGLENQSQQLPKVAEMAAASPYAAARDALFAPCSAASDGTRVGTPPEPTT